MSLRIEIVLQHFIKLFLYLSYELLRKHCIWCSEQENIKKIGKFDKNPYNITIEILTCKKNLFDHYKNDVFIILYE
jgi:hypothetical protein